MAQTKTTQKKRAAPKRSTGSQRSRSSGSGSTKASKRNKSNSSGNRSKSTPPVAETMKAAEKKAKNAGQSVGKAASKAKVPLIASGAAVAGAAGGLALASATRKSRPRWAGVRKPLFKVSSHDVANAAKEVGSFGAEVGKLASELQRNREAANGRGSTRRSPVEVVLEGLTSRHR
jgi:hypothetical protein